MSPFAYLPRLALAAALAVGFAATAEAQGRRKKVEETEKKEDDIKEKLRQEKTFPTRTTWTLTAINDKPLPAGTDMSFSLDDSYRGSGFAGCNTWSATVYPIRGQKLAMGPVAITKKQCDKAVMEREIAYLRALVVQPEWDMQGSDLIVKGKNGSLRFRRSL